MKKTVISWIAVSIAVMAVLPFAAVRLVRSDAGMAVCFILFFGVDPLLSILEGIAAGADIKKLHFLPVVNALIFLVSAWLIFTVKEPAFALYAGAYLLLGTAAMLVRALAGKRKAKE